MMKLKHPRRQPHNSGLRNLVTQASVLRRTAETAQTDLEASFLSFMPVFPTANGRGRECAAPIGVLFLVRPLYKLYSAGYSSRRTNSQAWSSIDSGDPSFG